MARHNDIGKDGEEAAAAYLLKNGYRIIEKNWIYRKFEIDIIACNTEYIIFMEVKTRSSIHWGNPEEAVSKSKIKRIVEAADFYLHEHDIDLPARFDVISVVWNGREYDVTHFDDAFLAPVN